MKHLDVAAISERFIFADGFHHPDWVFIGQSIEKIVSVEDQEGAWNEVVLLWLNKLREDLGGKYALYQSSETLLISDQAPETAQWLLKYSGKTACAIKQSLGETAWRGAFGKDVVLVFSEQDDYYQYLAHYSPDGEQASSGGVCIHSGYTHIAIPWSNQFDAANTIVHELAHDCVAHLSLPLWLNEGVALSLQRVLAPMEQGIGQSSQDALFAASIDWRPPLMWDELAEHHFSFWNETNIQSFWAGTSFHEPGDSNELSYSLAEVLMNLLSERCEPATFRAFLEAAQEADAGKSAAAEILKTDLGEIAATFLGEGEWGPRESAILSAWNASGWQQSSDRGSVPPADQ